MTWFETTNKFNKVPYNLGSLNYNDGLDCMTCMFRFLEDLGYDISKWDNDDYCFEYKGKKLNRNNYITELKTEEELRDAYLCFIRQEFKRTNELKRGYICVVEVIHQLAITVYLGFGRFLYITKTRGSEIIKLPPSNIKEIYK